MSSSTIGLALVLVALALIGCSPEPVQKVAPQPSGGKVPGETAVETSKVEGMESISKTVVVGKEAPDFTIKDVDGKEWKLSDYRGKTVLLDFWAFW
jgi:cytochrome oxidase Cu insertion factor (SCO1/SenC/PrrC family)